MPQCVTMHAGTTTLRTAILAVVVLLLSTSAVLAQTPSLMSGYQFAYSTGGSLTSMSGASQLVNSGTDDGRSGVTSIGFTFNFGGTNYTQFSASSNGLLGLGSTAVTTAYSISLSTSPYPWISAMGVDQITRGNGVRYVMTGTAPNRVLVVQWDTYRYSTSTSVALYEVRLYEGTNDVELVYGSSAAGVTNWSGRVGIVAGSSNYRLVNTSSHVSTSTSDVTTNSSFPAAGTTYRFFTCSPSVTIAGSTAQGAQTSTMSNGESIFADVSLQRGNTAALTPFTLSNPANGCAARTFSYSISGPAALDYQLSTTSGTLATGSENTPTITFNPRGTGTRTATLSISDNGSPAFSRSYTLAATATPRFVVTGIEAQGGSETMTSGDTLMRGIVVVHGATATFTPFTLSNTNLSPTASPLTYTVTLDSGSGRPTSQYSVVGASSAPIAAGATISPVIRFSPNPRAFGIQEARLTIATSDGDSRTYLLQAEAGAPQAHFSSNGVDIGPGMDMFYEVLTCVGEQVESRPVLVENIGLGDVVLTEMVIYKTDTTDRQGTPSFPLVRDSRGRPVAMTDYILTDVPGVAPISANTPVTLPVTIPQGARRQFYLTYIGQKPGRSFGRAFIRTTAENFSGIDTNRFDNTTIPPTSSLGLMSFELVARSHGADLAADSKGAALTPLVFPSVRAGLSMDRAVTITNAGVCDLRISKGQLRIFSGDVNEFAIVSAFTGSRLDAVSGDYVIAPGATDSAVVRFTPSRSGTRTATLRLRTNDSTVIIPGVTERGVMLFELHGRGEAGLDPRPLVLDPVVIGANVDGMAMLENSSTAPVEIGTITFDGIDAAQFAENPAKPWPARPFVVLPGARLELSVRMTPTGNAGTRGATLLLVSTANDSTRVDVRGEAGTQELVVAPSSLFDNVTVQVGGTARQMLKISNNGTLPIRIGVPTIAGPDSAQYRLGDMPRLDIEAGATEYLEVTLAPTMAGQLSAEITITPVNGTPQTVVLGGSAVKAHRDVDPTTGVAGGTIVSASERAGAARRLSGADAGDALAGMSLAAPSPNPVRGIAELAFTIAARADVAIAIHDAAGRRVVVVLDETRDAGAHRARVDLGSLAAGVYHCRMTAAGRTVTRSIVVAR